MQEIYGFIIEPDAERGRYVEMTVDHLFGTVWTGVDPDLRARRLARRADSVDNGGVRGERL